MLEAKHQPDLSLGCLQLWIHGREFPDTDDYWDGNWLQATAHCKTQTTSVEVSGPFIHLSDLKNLRENCEKLSADLLGSFHAEFLEPYLDLELTMNSVGQCETTVSLTPDNLTEEHRFTFQLDQSYLPPFINELKQILTTYPVIGV